MAVATGVRTGRGRRRSLLASFRRIAFLRNFGPRLVGWTGRGGHRRSSGGERRSRRDGRQRLHAGIHGRGRFGGVVIGRRTGRARRVVGGRAPIVAGRARLVARAVIGRGWTGIDRLGGLRVRVAQGATDLDQGLDHPVEGATASDVVPTQQLSLWLAVERGLVGLVGRVGRRTLVQGLHQPAQLLTRPVHDREEAGPRAGRVGGKVGIQLQGEPAQVFGRDLRVGLRLETGPDRLPGLGCQAEWPLPEQADGIGQLIGAPVAASIEEGAERGPAADQPVSALRGREQAGEERRRVVGDPVDLAILAAPDELQERFLVIEPGELPPRGHPGPWPRAGDRASRTSTRRCRSRCSATFLTRSATQAVSIRFARSSFHDSVTACSIRNRSSGLRGSRCIIHSSSCARRKAAGSSCGRTGSLAGQTVLEGVVLLKGSCRFRT